MKCWVCNNELIWGGDHDLDVEPELSEDWDGHTIVTNLSCPSCEAWHEVYHGKEVKMKSTFEKFKKKYGEGTAADLDYGKLTIIALCIYIAVQVS